MLRRNKWAALSWWKKGRSPFWNSCWMVFASALLPMNSSWHLRYAKIIFSLTNRVGFKVRAWLFDSKSSCKVFNFSCDWMRRPDRFRENPFVVKRNSFLMPVMCQLRSRICQLFMTDWWRNFIFKRGIPSIYRYSYCKVFRIRIIWVCFGYIAIRKTLNEIERHESICC